MSTQRRIIALLTRLHEGVRTLEEAGPNCTTGFGFQCGAEAPRAAKGLSKTQRKKAAKARATYRERTKATAHAEVAAAKATVEEFKETATSLARSLKRQGASAKEAKEAIIAQLQADAVETFLEPPKSSDGTAPVSPESAAQSLSDAIPGDRKPDQKKLADSEAVKAATDAVKDELSSAENLDEFSDLLDSMVDSDELPAGLQDQLGPLGRAMSGAGDWMPAYSPAFKKYAQKGLFDFLKELKGRLQYYSGMITDGITEAAQMALSIFPGFDGPKRSRSSKED